MIVTQLHVQIDSDKQTEVHFFCHMADYAGPVGMLVLTLEEGENTGWVSRVFVHPDYRRQGVAKALMEWAVLLCQQRQLAFLSLSVKNENLGAQRLYASLGFLPYMNAPTDYTQHIKVL